MLIGDLHIHSRYAQACSKKIDIPHLEHYARVKGLDLLGTGDFQHPLWRKELNQLEEQDGILYTEHNFPFVWQTEVSLIYTQGGQGRRIHHLLYAPNRDVANQITEFLASQGRLDYDGRPIFGMTSVELVERMKEISNEIEIIPAHVWTPWFSLFGANSGFDSLQECFQEMTKHIHAIETGMSSDPAMNRRLSQLDNVNMVSFSDLHSFWPWRIGREATAFDIEKEQLSYEKIIEAIRTKQGLVQTIETDPNYGKYHYDGHRSCNVRFSPEETRQYGGVCPQCGKPLTRGVEYRVEALADRSPTEVPAQEEFVRLIPLSELISFAYGVKQIFSKTVWRVFNQLIERYGTEYTVLLEAPYEDLVEMTNETLAQAVTLARRHELTVLPGYDGTYGQIVLDTNADTSTGTERLQPTQQRLDSFSQ